MGSLRFWFRQRKKKIFYSSSSSEQQPRTWRGDSHPWHRAFSVAFCVSSCEVKCIPTIWSPILGDSKLQQGFYWLMKGLRESVCKSAQEPERSALLNQAAANGRLFPAFAQTPASFQYCTVSALVICPPAALPLPNLSCINDLLFVPKAEDFMPCLFR